MSTGDMVIKKMKKKFVCKALMFIVYIITGRVRGVGFPNKRVISSYIYMEKLIKAVSTIDVHL